MFAQVQDQLKVNYDKSMEEERVTPDKDFWMDFITDLWFKLLIWLIGAWKTFEEQILNRHRRHYFTKPPVSNEKARKVAIITGGNRGIGFEAVKGLLNINYKVIIACRDVNACQKNLEKLSSDNVEYCEVQQLDLSKVESVERFAAWVNEEHDGPVNLLINNAGTMFGPRIETDDGYETQMATNYLGHFLLTHRIINKLRESATADDKSRIVNVTSCAHLAGRWMDFNDLNLTSGYTPERAYAHSKMSQVLYTMFLNSQLQSWSDGFENITVNCLHPGIIKTGLYQNVSWMTTLIGFLMKSPSEGADTILYAATSTDEKLVKGGHYIENSQICSPSGFAQDYENQVSLWQNTLKMLKLEDQDQDQPQDEPAQDKTQQ